MKARRAFKIAKNRRRESCSAHPSNARAMREASPRYRRVIKRAGETKEARTICERTRRMRRENEAHAHPEIQLYVIGRERGRSVPAVQLQRANAVEVFPCFGQAAPLSPPRPWSRMSTKYGVLRTAFFIVPPYNNQSPPQRAAPYLRVCEVCPTLQGCRPSYEVCRTGPVYVVSSLRGLPDWPYRASRGFAREEKTPRPFAGSLRDGKRFARLAGCRPVIKTR